MVREVKTDWQTSHNQSMHRLRKPALSPSPLTPTYEIRILCPSQQLSQERILTDPPADINLASIMAFAHAHVPLFTVAELSLPAWDQINKRYKSCAA